MRTVPILFTFTQSLAMPAGVCLTSLLECAEPETFYDIFIIHGPGCDFSSLNVLKERFANFRLTFREVSGEFVGAYEIRGIPETAYYRLLSPEIIPEYDKLLYSDVDVIIREDLSKYYDLDLGDNYFAAVDNCSRLRPSMRESSASTGGTITTTPETWSSIRRSSVATASSTVSANSGRTTTTSRTWTSSTSPATNGSSRSDRCSA